MKKVIFSIARTVLKMNVTLFLILLISFIYSFEVKAQCISGLDSCGSTTDFCGPYSLSRGIYRIPYLDGTDVFVTNDHMNHCPRGRFDLIGINDDSSPYQVVAAADGWIRSIIDSNTVKCSCSISSCENNYVWIEHQNGEWTKYTHFAFGSVTALGWQLNDWINSGEILGSEGFVGCASGVHLHFEVAQPIDTTTLVYSEIGGFIDGNFAVNLVPVICSITDNIFQEGGTYTADPCTNNCPASLVLFNPIVDFPFSEIRNATSDITLNSGQVNTKAAMLLQAGDFVDFKEGFIATSGSMLTAQIAGCNDFNLREPFMENSIMENLTHGFMQVLVSPNPFEHRTFLDIQLPMDDKVSIDLFDISGRKVFTTGEQKLLAGSYQFGIDLNDEPNGIYLLIIRNIWEINESKIVKISNTK